MWQRYAQQKPVVLLQFQALPCVPGLPGKVYFRSEHQEAAAVILVLALAVFGFTVAAALKGRVWVLPAVLSHIAFWGYFGYVLSRISYVPYEE